MFKTKIENDLKSALVKLGFTPDGAVVTKTEDQKFGDYTTNVSLQLSKQGGVIAYQSPRDVANAIIEKFATPDYIEKVELAGPGFINFYLKDTKLVTETLLKTEHKNKEKLADAQHYLVEYASPNTHKPLHIGHLRNLSLGLSIVRLLQSQGHDVFTVTYTSDIGPSVAKALWGVKQAYEEFEAVKDKSLREKAEFLGRAYVTGSNAYEDDSKAKEEIDEITKGLFTQEPEITKLWLETRAWSAGYLDTVHSGLGSEFDAEVWESEVGESGKQIVLENLNKVFVEDQGAIIFPGEKYGLHNRVFINSRGNPIYEAKDVGLAFKQLELYPFDKAIHIVASEQASYFKVLFKAIEMIEPSLVGKKYHLSYGMLNLSTGKMSSRKGNIKTAEGLIDEVEAKIAAEFNKGENPSDKQLSHKIAVAAIKFWILKYAVASDIAFDVEQSISLHGDTGPYVMYGYARIQSVLDKAKSQESGVRSQQRLSSSEDQGSENMDSLRRLADRGNDRAEKLQTGLEVEEREILRQLEYFEGVVETSAADLAPNKLAEYLLNLTKAFNSFYEKYQVIGSEKEEFRLQLISQVAATIKRGLYLLGIETVERM